MLKNYITEDFLKMMEPEVENYLWRGENDFSKQREYAEMCVGNDFKRYGFDLSDLMNELELWEGTNNGANEIIGVPLCDEIQRGRAIVNVSSVSGSADKVVYVQGSNDADSENWVNAGEVSFKGDGVLSFLLSGHYKYYRVRILIPDGHLNCNVFLVESIYDLFFAYRWLEVIYVNIRLNENDRYGGKHSEYRNKYNDLWKGSKIFYDNEMAVTGKVKLIR
jgi:hypothetical protein